MKKGQALLAYLWCCAKTAVFVEKSEQDRQKTHTCAENHPIPPTAAPSGLPGMILETLHMILPCGQIKYHSCNGL